MNESESRFLTTTLLPYGGAFALALLVIFLSQTWPYWAAGRLLPGTHADGAFHYYSELARLSPALFPNDPAINSNRDLGYYEHFYGTIAALARRTGIGLMPLNLILCWLGNGLYLLGVLVALRRLGLPPAWCGIGVVLAAQVYILIGMWSGVVHSLVIPREFWLWPLPWFLAWFLGGGPQGAGLIAFYAALGLVYAWSYPLWAALFGLAFGLADLSRILRSGSLSELWWLAAGAAACIVFVALPSIGILKVAGKEGSAVMDYNQITRSVYLTKGFRRLALFLALGVIAVIGLKRGGALTPSAERVAAVMIGSFAVCCLYEPLQRLVPSLSLLYLGRLSLVVFLASMLLVTLALSRELPRWSLAGRIGCGLAIAVFCLEPQRALRKESRPGNLPANPDFVAFAETVKARTTEPALGVFPPETGSHYFRVFSERGLWIDPKDLGILSRTKSSYAAAQERLAKLREFYAKETSPSSREGLLLAMASQGVTFVVTRRADPWTGALSWKVAWEEGGWQLREAPTR